MKPKYSKRQLTGLEKSISYWDRICHGLEIPIGMWGCELCSLYNFTFENMGCSNKCPIKMATGENICKDTPYNDAAINIIPHLEMIAAREEMLIFLLKLLPEGHKWRDQI